MVTQLDDDDISEPCLPLTPPDEIQTPFCENEPNTQQRFVHEAPQKWRCLKCFSSDYTWNWMRDQYECFSCGSCEFLQELPQTVPSDRSWMYRPADGDFPGDINRAPSETGTSSSQRRRQRRRQRGKGNPPWHPSDAAEWAESEAMTHDPSIDPDAPLHVPSVQTPHEEHGNRSLAGNSAGAARAHPSAAGSGRSNSVTSKPSEDVCFLHFGGSCRIGKMMMNGTQQKVHRKESAGEVALRLKHQPGHMTRRTFELTTNM